MMPAPHKPLSALLSQILVAYTVELDCEFERRMLQTQSRGARASRWSFGLMCCGFWPMDQFRFERSLRARSQPRLAPQPGWVASNDGASLRCSPESAPVSAAAEASAPIGRFGSRPAVKTAVRIWPDLIPEIDARWSKRFGDDATRLRRSLEAIEHQIDLELPQGLPVAILKLPEFGPRKSAAEDGLPLPVLLSRVLLAFALDFERESQTPISLCANAIRVLSDEPIPEAEIPKRTGCSEETAGIGWQHKPYIIVERDPARGRGKFVRLSEAGIKAQHEYYTRTRDIEEKWKKRFGAATKEIRESLTTLLTRSELSDGLKPPARNHPRRCPDAGPGPRRHWTCGTPAQAGFGHSDGSIRARSGWHSAALSALGYEPRLRSVVSRVQVSKQYDINVV